MPAQGARVARRRAPGEDELWILILGDLAVFAVFFGVWSWNQATQPEVFAEGHARMDLSIGLVNTLALVTSSAAVARAVVLVRCGQPTRASRALAAAFGLGLLFVALKAVEYREHVAHGTETLRTDFFLYYFVFTGIHLVHVLVGLVGLAVLIARCRSGEPSRRLLEGVAVYWHMVDLLWIVLFYLVYLA